MALYRIENLFQKTEEKEFKTDKSAWNNLRKKMISEDGNGFFMTMYKEIEVEVPVNNEEEYVKSHNSFYGSRPYGYGPELAKLMTVVEPNMTKIWIPVLDGITSHTYNVTKKEII